MNKKTHFSPRPARSPTMEFDHFQKLQLDDGYNFYSSSSNSRTQDFFYATNSNVSYTARTPTPKAPNVFGVQLRSPRNRKKTAFPKTQPNSPRYKVEQFYKKSREECPPENEKEIDFFINENSEEAEKVSAQILFNERVSCKDPEILKLSIINIQQKRDFFNQTGKFRDAENAEIAIRKARELLLDAMKTEVQNQELADISIRTGHTTTDLSICSHFIEAKEEELDNKLENAMNAMLKRHEDELRELDEQWDSDTKRRLFNKTSPQLRELRNQQKRLIKAKKFEEADELSRIADAMHKHEQEVNGKKLLLAYNEAKRSLLKKQNEEKDLLEKKISLKKTVFQHTAEVQKESLKNRERVLNIRKVTASDKEALWRQKKSRQIEFNFIPKESKSSEIDFNVDNPVTLGLPSLSDSIRRIKNK